MDSSSSPSPSSPGNDGPLRIWRPTSFSESADGRPLVTRAAELFDAGQFPYDRLPSEDRPVLALFLRPYVVYALIVLYVVSDRPIEIFRKVVGLDSRGVAFRSFVALHNLALAVFSLVVAYNSWGVVLLHLSRRGFDAVYCDRDGTLWSGGLGAWATIFYLSKFYEFLDTWILVLKNKRASFLQVYHHAGIVFAMYGAVASQSAWLLWVVLLNSVIHTLMYAYFFIKTVSPQVDIPQAKYLTMAQIGQFLTGIFSTLGVLWMGEACDTQSSRFSLACLHAYGLGLIALFVSFANRKYKES